LRIDGYDGWRVARLSETDAAITAFTDIPALHRTTSQLRASNSIATDISARSFNRRITRAVDRISAAKFATKGVNALTIVVVRARGLIRRNQHASWRGSGNGTTAIIALWEHCHGITLEDRARHLGATLLSC